jgi:hypothetical protein
MTLHQEDPLLIEATMAATARTNELSVETRRSGAHTIVIVTGRVTVESFPQLRSVLQDTIGAAPSAGIVIELDHIFLALGYEVQFT